MDKAYEPQRYEADIYRRWEQSGAFAPTNDPTAEPYCIIMPPPNANGELHAGHGMYVVEDIMTRYARMCGKAALWLPGTDHAGIETQVVFERELEKQGKSRFDYSRPEFYNLVKEFVLGKQHVILDGFRALGFSADWSRLKFTLDDDIVGVVYDTFRKMHDDGLVYRAKRIVNWCPRCHAGFADIELKYRTRLDPLYYVKYGPFVVATVRPELMYADTAIAVHPKDERYARYIGTTVPVELLWGKRELPVIAEPHVDPEFGSGAVKVTPAHDPNDWEMALNHGLEVINGLNTDGTLNQLAGRFAGMPTEQARSQIAKDLEERGLIDHIDMSYEHAVAVHDRDDTVIEPLTIEQWWVSVDKLKKPAIEAAKSGAIKFFPARYAKMYISWLENLRDWNISRQIAWGIPIPVYYNATGDAAKPDHIIAESDAEAEKTYGAGGFEKETDTFDTWFSSSQWPYATLMTARPGDFERFYPTAVMGTAREILYFWVTRMVMMGLYHTDKVPFQQVYLWGLVNDAHGKKMSKSRGNVVSPLVYTERYGADAFRLALTIGITPGVGGSISDEKIAGYRNFCNKLWNVARYALTKLSTDYSPAAPELRTDADHWLSGRLQTLCRQVTQNLDGFRFSEAGQLIYSFLWDDLADRYIEYSKQDLNADLLVYALETLLKLLHPIAPFVTEAIWANLSWRDGQLITEPWPEVALGADSQRAAAAETVFISAIAGQSKQAALQKRAALERTIARKQNLIRLTETKLQNAGFAANAPKAVVEREQQTLAETRSQLKELEGELAKLSG